jgi:hypothetical protein
MHKAFSFDTAPFHLPNLQTPSPCVYRKQRHQSAAFLLDPSLSSFLPCTVSLNHQHLQIQTTQSRAAQSSPFPRERLSASTINFWGYLEDGLRPSPLPTVPRQYSSETRLGPDRLFEGSLSCRCTREHAYTNGDWSSSGRDLPNFDESRDDTTIRGLYIASRFLPSRLAGRRVERGCIWKFFNWDCTWKYYADHYPVSCTADYLQMLGLR